MRDIFRCRPLLAGALLTAGLMPATAMAAVPSAQVTDPATVSAASASLGVVAQDDGWLSYTHTQASSLALTGKTTTTLTGTVDADGTCSISSAGTATAASPETYQEEVGFNPTTCQERLLTGTISASDAAKIAPTDTGNALETPALSTSSVALASTTSSPDATNGADVAPSAVAAATSYGTEHEKTAWIDPVNITITSLAANLKWPLYGKGGTISGRVNPYEFKYDGWSSTGPSPIKFPALPGNAGWSLRETDSFTNNDFAAIVYTLLGPAGWAACGFHLSTTAHFHHDVTVKGYKNNNRGWAWKDSKSGACSNLVHHREQHGSGWVS